VNILRLWKDKKSQRGQVWVLLAISLVVLLAFVGLGIDLGLAYVAKTTLAKAVDAAALTTMKNVSLGTGSVPSCNITSPAGLAGAQAFNINYNSVPNLSTTPVPNICFSLDANSNTLVTVTASATLNTYFIRVLDLFGGNYDTLSIGASAQAQRNPLVMSLVLDVSASMKSNGGEAALAPAVENFVNDFDPNNNDAIDHVSMVSFGSSGQLNVDNAQPFKNSIDTAVSAVNWGVTNYTNSEQGLKLGQTEILKIAQTPNLLRVLVFFTDGWPNIIGPDTLTCAKGTGKTPTTASLLYCGCDPGDISLGLCGNTDMVFFDPASCSASNNTCNPPTSGCGTNTAAFPNPTVFPDLAFGSASKSLTSVVFCGGSTTGGTAPGAANLVSDAMYRAALVANDPNTYAYTGQVGLQNQNTYIYAIGMGTAITGQPTAEEFLREVANDPAAVTFNTNLPVGEAVFASDSTQLNQVFQTIASKILLRLSK
jgi:hypothetical protein